MADEYLGVTNLSESGGTDTQPIGEQVQSTESERPEPVTKRELETWSKEFRKDLLNVIRSQTGQTESNIKKDVDARLNQVDENFKKLRAAGYPVTEEDLKVAKSRELTDALRTLPNAEGDSRSSHEPAVDIEHEAVIQKTSEALRSLEKRYGYVMDQHDPEYWELKNAGIFDSNVTTPEKCLAMYQQKLQEINTRLGRPLPAAEATGSIAARMPPPAGMPVGGNQEQQLNTRLREIQETDPYKRNPSLSKERGDIVKQLEVLSRSK
jgi:hypothetical protein